jgi:hypothetical protein
MEVTNSADSPSYFKTFNIAEMNFFLTPSELTSSAEPGTSRSSIASSNGAVMYLRDPVPGTWGTLTFGKHTVGGSQQVLPRSKD